MVAQVEVAAVVDALELLPAEREAVLDVDRLLGVVGQLVGRVLAQPQPLGRHAVPLVPRLAPGQPEVERLRCGVTGAHEVLHLHLLELAHPEHEVAGRDLVAEGLADLGDAEGQLLAARLLDVLEVDVRTLGGLGAEVDDVRLLLDRAHVRLEHQVEAPRRGQRAAIDRALQAQALDDGLVLELRRGQATRRPAAHRAGTGGGTWRTPRADRRTTPRGPTSPTPGGASGCPRPGRRCRRAPGPWLATRRA